jgi:esterase/lipase superfamily enzyme
MGNRLLTRAIEKILSSLPDVRLTEVMLTAPDIDTDVFLNQIAPAIVGAARRTTLYVSSDDEALRLSGQWRPRPRAGDSSQQVVVAAGIDTVDVTAVSTGLVGHSYYGDNRSVLSDIFNVIKGQTPAERFGLEPRQAPGGQYWVFRP